MDCQHLGSVSARSFSETFPQKWWSCSIRTSHCCGSPTALRANLWNPAAEHGDSAMRTCVGIVRGQVLRDLVGFGFCCGMPAFRRASLFGGNRLKFSCTWTFRILSTTCIERPFHLPEFLVVEFGWDLTSKILQAAMFWKSFQASRLWLHVHRFLMK